MAGAGSPVLEIDLLKVTVEELQAGPVPCSLGGTCHVGLSFFRPAPSLSSASSQQRYTFRQERGAEPRGQVSVGRGLFHFALEAHRSGGQTSTLHHEAIWGSGCSCQFWPHLFFWYGRVTRDGHLDGFAGHAHAEHCSPF